MDHFEAREKVCVICYRKASRLLSSTDIEAVQNVVIENYNPDNPNYPCGICSPCHAILTEHRLGDIHRSLPVVTDYNPGMRILTRGQSVCSCRICTVAKANGVAAKAMKENGAGHLNLMFQQRNSEYVTIVLHCSIRVVVIANLSARVKRKN